MYFRKQRYKECGKGGEMPSLKGLSLFEALMDI